MSAPQAAHPERAAELHPEAAPTSESAIGASPVALGGVWSALGADAPAETPARLASSPVMRHPTGGELRAHALRRVQVGAGNRRAQQIVAQVRRASLVQRQCSCGTCAACQSRTLDEDRAAAVQRQTAHAGADGGLADASVVPADSPGRPLDDGTREFMESRFGRDFSDVRVHTDGAAAQSAAALDADAYTTGRDIYFGAGRYAPDSTEGQHLIAHELTHTIQQGQGEAPVAPATMPSGSVLVGRADDPLEEEAERTADAAIDGAPHGAVGSSVSPDGPSAVRRGEWKSLTNNPVTNTISSGVRKGADFISGQIERLAPGAIGFFRNIKNFFSNALSKGADGVFGGLLGSIREKGLAATLEGLIGSFVSGALRAAGGFIVGECAAMGRLAEHALEIATKLGGSALEELRKTFESIRGSLESVWTEYGAPAVDWIKKKVKAAWKEVEDTASKIWNWLKPLREGIAAVWNEVTDLLSEGRRSFSDWLDGFLPKAIAAWEEVKAKLKPHMDKVKTGAKIVGAIVLLFSPAGPFVVAGVAVYALYQGLKLVWEKWGKGFTAETRAWWAKEALPSIQGKLKEFRTTVDGLKKKVQGALQDAADFFLHALDEIGVIAFLQSVKSAIDAIGVKIRGLKAQLDHKLEEWSQKLHALLVAADPYLQQIKEALRQSLVVAQLGPLAFLDDGVWHTLERFVAFVMRTPCLRELGGVTRLPSQLQRLGKVRAGIKEAFEVIKNPAPLLEKLRVAIEPMVLKIEPLVRSGVGALAAGFVERQLYIESSILHYLGDSLADLRANWWTQLKKIGGDLLWPWPEVAKDFGPMIDAFGGAISSAFNLEFSDAIDKFLEGMRKFNGIAGNLSGWFFIISVIVGGTLGALGFAFGPAGVATVGAGAAAGAEFAGGVGEVLLGVALATEAAVIVKSTADLQFNNPRIADEKKRQDEDQKDCKNIAGSLISVVTMGALILLADIAAKFGKFLYGLVEDVPIVKDLATLAKDVKEKVGDFSFKKDPATGDVAADVGAKPTDVKAGDVDTAPKDPTDSAGKGEEHGVPREQLEAEAKDLQQRATPDSIRQPSDPRFDAEIDSKGHTYDREADTRNWCRFSNESCGLKLPAEVDAAADAAKAKHAAAKETAKPKPGETGVETKPGEPGAETKPGEPPWAEDLPPEKKAELQKELDDAKTRRDAAQDRVNDRLREKKALQDRANDLRKRAALDRRNGDLLRQAREAEDAAAQAGREAEALKKDLVDAQLDFQRKSWQLNTDARSKLPCFASGTLVWTSTGLRAIETLIPNDRVLAYDFANRTTVERRVLEVMQNRTMRFHAIDVGGDIVRATSLHRFWVESEQEWVEARQLRPGMTLLTPSGASAAVVHVEVCEAPNASTFNLHVEAACTYFVGAGVLAHNQGGPTYNFGKFRIYEGVNPKFPDKVYIGQTDDIGRRQGEHRAEAIEKLKDPNLTPEQREFWEFKKDIELRQRVAGLDADQANYLEQKNMEIERNSGKDLMNRREQVSRENMGKLEEKIKADPRVQEAKLCP